MLLVFAQRLVNKQIFCTIREGRFIVSQIECTVRSVLPPLDLEDMGEILWNSVQATTLMVAVIRVEVSLPWNRGSLNL